MSEDEFGGDGRDGHGGETVTEFEARDAREREKAAAARIQTAYTSIVGRVGEQPTLPQQWEGLATTKLLLELGVFTKAQLLEAAADQAEASAASVIRQMLQQSIPHNGIVK